MVPVSITRNLSRLRFRERTLRFVWGAARWIALVIVLLWLGGLLDWFIDREQDTPFALRATVLAAQIGVAACAAIVWIFIPLLRRYSDDELALRVEAAYPPLANRLITTVQLNRPGADLHGMSKELIDIVSQDTELACRSMDFANVADHARLENSVKLALPLAALAIAPFLFFPHLASVLLARQGLADVEIPHSLYIESIAPEVWPKGERLRLAYRVTGPAVDDKIAESVGKSFVSAVGQATDVYELSFVKKNDAGEAIFEASVAPGSIDFVHRARLRDGRTRTNKSVRLVPRPAIVRLDAFVVLPAFCGLRPDGQRYEVPQSRGEVAGIAGSGVRVTLDCQKPIKKATLELLKPDVPPTDAAKDSKAADTSLAQTEPKANESRPMQGVKSSGSRRFDESKFEEVVERSLAMAISSDGVSAEASFDLSPTSSGYRITVEDEFGFVNVPASRRSLRLVPEDPPTVTLLKDDFGGGLDIDLEGMPVRNGYPIRAPYVAHGPYGLGQAFLLYRVLKKRASGSDDTPEDPVTRLPLVEVAGNAELGPFNPKRGVFQNQTEDDETPFHAVPSPEPDRILGRTLGGGRLFLQTKGLVRWNGTPVVLKPGDSIEYCFEVHADRRPNSSRPVARSESRIVSVVNETDFFIWLDQLTREQERLRGLENQQRGVLRPPGE